MVDCADLRRARHRPGVRARTTTRAQPLEHAPPPAPSPPSAQPFCSSPRDVPSGAHRAGLLHCGGLDTVSPTVGVTRVWVGDARVRARVACARSLRRYGAGVPDPATGVRGETCVLSLRQAQSRLAAAFDSFGDFAAGGGNLLLAGDTSLVRKLGRVGSKVQQGVLSYSTTLEPNPSFGYLKVKNLENLECTLLTFETAEGAVSKLERVATESLTFACHCT